ncbi:type II toxin-antitoxin system VapC family toxin [uncultured Roseobacter sp.]|uniref:type II toxin-antitoxin system VapC family toxin n=1 Tax=uncultured Roseobacter sp. TaxID=114847 RepID=UPI00260CEA0A|nr:type II toxin-antitoxin system VapC family toxin [uncultured Roseobacter sp.]
MNLLIDTHILLWAAFEPRRLPRDAHDRLMDPDTRLWFSAVSIWEVAIKRGLDRPDFRIDPGPLRAGLLANEYSELALEGRHCLGLGTLPGLHADPFDRMLIVQAAAQGMALLTADSKIAQYGGPALLVT